MGMKERLEVDEMKLFFGEPMQLNEHITIYQPTVGDIIRYGEKEYFALVHNLCAVPSDMILPLLKVGIDWNDIEEWELFSMLVLTMKPEATKILFGDLDWSKFKIIPNTDGTRGHVLHHTELDFDFDELDYKVLVSYLSKMHGLKRQNKTAGNERTKKMMIEMAQDDLAASKRKGYKSQFRNLISTMLCMPGFKYSLAELKDVGLCQFLDSVNRIQVIQSSLALMQGCYSGNVDTKKLKKSELNYMRELK